MAEGSNLASDALMSMADATGDSQPLEEDSGMGGFEQVAEDVYAAIEAKDSGAFKDALHACIESVMAGNAAGPV